MVSLVRSRIPRLDLGVGSEPHSALFGGHKAPVRPTMSDLPAGAAGIGRPTRPGPAEARKRGPSHVAARCVRRCPHSSGWCHHRRLQSGPLRQRHRDHQVLKAPGPGQSCHTDRHSGDRTSCRTPTSIAWCSTFRVPVASTTRRHWCSNSSRTTPRPPRMKLEFVNIAKSARPPLRRRMVERTRTISRGRRPVRPPRLSTNGPVPVRPHTRSGRRGDPW